MFYQIVSFTFPEDLDARERGEFEASLRDLPNNIAELSDVRVARAHDDQNVTGYISVFGSESDYQAYLKHPAHAPVGERAGVLCSGITRLLMDDTSSSVLAT